MTGSPRPPRAARALLRRALPPDLRDDVAADLDELYQRRVARRGVGRARVWYVAQVMSFTARFALEGRHERLRSNAAGADGPDPARERARLRRLLPVGMSLLDWKLGARMVVRYPGLSLIGGSALAVAIAMGAGAYETVQEELYPELPLDEGDRVVRVENWDASALAPEPRSLHDFAVWREQVTSIEELGAYRALERNLLTPDGRVEPVRVAEITASAFPLTRVPPLLGRPLAEADESPGAQPVVVLSHDVWQRRFDRDPAIVGSVVRLGRAEATVVGVMPEGYGFPVSHQLWVPLQVEDAPPREGPPVEIFGRLAPGATFETAQAELATLGQRMAASNPETHADLRPRVRAYVGPSPGDGTPLPVLLMYVAVALVMLVASANVATLVFARTAMREPEIVVRNAIGASRGRVIGQLFAESLVLAGIAAAAGLAIAGLGIGYIWHQAVNVRRVPQPFWRDSTLEPETVVYTALLAVFGAALIGLIPAIRATGPQVQAGLQKMASGGGNMRFGGIWTVIIVAQVAITVVCLPISIGVSRETLRDHQARAEFVSGEYLTFRPELDREGTLGGTSELTDAEFRSRMAAVYEELERRLTEEPVVTAATFADRLPGMSTPYRRVEAQRDGEPPVPVPGNLEGNIRIASVATDFFEVFDVPIVAGRGFHSGDLAAEHGVVVVNESFVRNLGGSALGVRVRYAAQGDEEPGPWHEVVGVARNIGLDPTDRGESDFMFHPATPADAYPPYVALRVSGDAAVLAPRLSSIALRVDAGLRLYDVLPLDEVVRRRDLPVILLTLAMTVVVFVAMLLSAAGLFALMSVAVARRTREIGIRLALGASARGVLSAIFARAAAQLGLGIAVGNLLIVLLVNTLGSGMAAGMLVPLVAISGIMVLVGMLASAVPARRALRVHPTEALRQS